MDEFKERPKKEEEIKKDKDLIKVIEGVFDRRTELNTFFIMRELGVKKIFGPVSSGKEAKVFPAITNKGEWLAFKIYYVSAASTKRAIAKYLEMGKEGIISSNTRKIITAWARREFNNLETAFKAKVKVPEPITVKENVLVMKFIGENGKRAIHLYEYEADESSLYDIYNKIIKNLIKLVKCAKLIHSDLSEYNIMIHEGEAYFIDMSQAISCSLPNSREFLSRDIRNILSFFKKKGIEEHREEDVIKMIEEGECD